MRPWLVQWNPGFTSADLLLTTFCVCLLFLCLTTHRPLVVLGSLLEGRPHLQPRIVIGEPRDTARYDSPLAHSRSTERVVLPLPPLLAPKVAKSHCLIVGRYLSVRESHVHQFHPTLSRLCHCTTTILLVVCWEATSPIARIRAGLSLLN